MVSCGFIDVVAMTHHGAKRSRNEDTILVGGWLRSTPMDVPQKFRLALNGPIICMVADGIGGHAAGHEASRLACQHLRAEASSLTSEQAVAAAVIAAADQISEAALSNAEFWGMGTTVAGLVMESDGAFWFNVGDSGVFRHRNGFLRQISSDDIPLGEVAGRRSNRITQCLGGGENDIPVSPHTGREQLEHASRYLICSDGLTDMLTMGEIEAELDLDDPVGTVSKLHAAAMNAGGVDNISIILVSWAKETLEELNVDE